MTPNSTGTAAAGHDARAALRVAHQVAAQHHAGGRAGHEDRQAHGHLRRRHAVQMPGGHRREGLHCAQREREDEEETEAGPHRRQAQEVEAAAR